MPYLKFLHLSMDTALDVSLIKVCFDQSVFDSVNLLQNTYFCLNIFESKFNDTIVITESYCVVYAYRHWGGQWAFYLIVGRNVIKRQ